VRWEVELSIKLAMSVHRLDQIDAEWPCSVKTRLHASLVASTLAAVLATATISTPVCNRLERPGRRRRCT
jgi:hypothetical protein